MNYTDLQKVVNEEKTLYLTNTPTKQKDMKKRLHKRYLIWKYLYYFRSWQFNRDLRSDKGASSLCRKVAKFKSHYFEKKKNIFSYKSGVEIGAQCKIGKNCDIWHSGVVINGDVGDNCTFHGKMEKKIWNTICNLFIIKLKKMNLILIHLKIIY